MSIPTIQTESELMLARRAFPVAQEGLAGGTSRVAAPSAAVGWHSSSVSPETGAVALVRADGALADLVGEIIRVHYLAPGRDRSVYVYVLGSSARLEESLDLSLSRRSFLALEGLYAEEISAVIEVVA
jgi:hypothetical protein